MERPIRLDETMDRAMSATFEGMTFSEVARMEGGTGQPPERVGEAFGERAAWAVIEVRVPAAGQLYLVVADGVAGRLEAMVTGAESGEEAGRLDALAECLNALAGLWARSLVPAARAVELGLPKTGRGRPGGVDVDEWAVYLTDEDQRILVARVR